MGNRQAGAGGLLIAVVLLLVFGGLIATLAFLRARGEGERLSQDPERFETIKSAMAQFVAINSRLPCPANPTSDAGTADPDSPSATCNSLQGTVPWKTIGIRRDDAIDAWGGKISYRVYARSVDGSIAASAGSLTQANGVSLVNCDTNQSLSAGRTQVVSGAGGLCRNARDTLDSEVLVGKGLAINLFGTAISGAAYVLVSHGPSGLGAYPATVPALQKDLPASASELANLAAAGPFVATNRTAASIGPSDTTHFDDVLAYQSITDLVKLAGMGARDWTDTTGTSNVTLDAATVAAALEAAVAANLGQGTLNVNNARITGISSGATQNLTFDTASGSGIGTSADESDPTIAVGERLRIEFNAKATKFGVTLNHFGEVNYFGTWSERVRFQFYNGATFLGSSTKEGCRADGGLASFSFDLGSTEFDKVEIVPLVSTVHPFFGTTITSAFWLAAFKSCTSGTCQTSLYALGNACP